MKHRNKPITLQVLKPISPTFSQSIYLLLSLFGLVNFFVIQKL
jgi:hypothetical protein